MKASEILRRYNNGERNFSQISLRGVSFKGRVLSEVNFSETDIRGAEFTNASLLGANFSKAQAGLQRRWVALILIGSTALLTLSSFPLAITGWWLTYFFLPKTVEEFSVLPGLFIVAVLAVLFRFILYEGIDAALVGLAGVGTATVAGTAFAAAVGAAKIAVAIAIAAAAAAVGTGAAALAGAAAIVGSSIIARIKSAIVVVAISATVTGVVSGLAALAVAETGGATTAVAMEAAGAGGGAIFMAGLGGVVSIGLSTAVSWLTLNESERHNRREKYIRVWKIANALAAIKGTSFRNADLTDANFTEARLKSTDLREANLTRTRWQAARKLGYARLGDSYLQNPKVLQLVVERNGEGKDFDHLLNLQGINLEGANLKNANFTGSVLKDATLENADLTKANLTGANLIATRLNNTDLYWAKLIRTQLDQADLTGACLTGACIEDWNITTQTGLDDIRCDYVFMSSSEESRRRQPDDEKKNFEEGEFSEFIVPMVQTLNLYHNKSINPSALAIAYNDLCVNHPEAELEIASIERRGKYRSKFLVRVFTSEQADHSKLHEEYFSRYGGLQSLSPETLRSLLIQSERGFQLLAFLFYIRPTYSIGGDTVFGDKINIRAEGGSVVNLGEIKGSVSTAINQLPNSIKAGESSLKDLLTQLKTAIEDEPELGDADKATALKQVQVLADAGQAPKQGVMQETAKSASRMLRGIVAELPNAAKLAEACSKLLPMILSLFGL